jgi:hypothetical protein
LARGADAQDKIVQYLKQRGGGIESVDGRGLTQALAGAVGGVSISWINATLARLERDGVIVRDVRGKRTYLVALVGADTTRVAEPASTPLARDDRRPRGTAKPTTTPAPGDPAIAELSASVAQLAARLSEFERMVAAQQAHPRRWWRRRGR